MKRGDRVLFRELIRWAWGDDSLTEGEYVGPHPELSGRAYVHARTACHPDGATVVVAIDQLTLSTTSTGDDHGN